VANECIPFYKPGEDITAQAGAAVVGKTFAKISANRQSGPTEPANTAVVPTDGGNYLVVQCTAAARAIGVFAYDAASGDKVKVIRGGIVPVTAGATITFGQEVECDAAGKAIPFSAGIKLGVAMTGASAAGDAEIALNV
jgi:hypothetical protein